MARSLGSSLPSAPASITTLDDSALARDSPLASACAGSGGALSAAGPLSAPGSEHGGVPHLALPKGLLMDGLRGIYAGSTCSGSGKDSWKSAEDSAAQLGAGDGSSTECRAQGGGGAAAAFYDDLQDEEEECGDGPYGADAWRSPWRRHEGMTTLWILLVLLAAMAVNVGVGLDNSRRASRAAAAAAAAAVLPPPSMPPGPLRKRRRPSPPMPPMPPQPSPPPPAFCDVATGNLARYRFSNITAVFPAPVSHYSANLVEKTTLDHYTRYPAYYNGVVPRFCIMGVEAVYTCMKEDNPCNYSPEVALRLCQTACPNTGENCQNINGLTGHPLLARSCGLFALSKPSCINIGYTQNKERQMRAFYKLNMCQAPPGPRPPPRPPLPPAQPPPPFPPPAEYYYYR